MTETQTLYDLLNSIDRDGMAVLCQGPAHYVAATTRNGKVMGAPRTWDSHPTPEQAVANLTAKIADADASDRAMWRNAK